MTTDNKKSTGAYAPDKALAHPDRLTQLRNGQQPYPVHLHLIISDLCDLDCPQCAYRLSGYSSNQLFNAALPDGRVTHNPNRMLNRELVLSILDDCKAMGCRAVEYTGGGEPTIHPNAPELLDYAQHLGLDTALITNGLHLARMGEAAVKTQWLRISVDAATRETYAKVRPSFGGVAERSAQNFGKALSAIQQAVEMRNRLKTDCLIGVGFVVQKENWHELLNAARLFKALGVDNVRISGAFTPDGADYHADYRFEAEELERAAVRELNSDTFKVHGRFREKMADLAARPDYQKCWYQELTTYIGGDGNLYRCCVTSYNAQGLIGNVKEAGGFKALWESKVKQFHFKHFDARTCSRCQFNDRNKAIDAAVKAPELPAAPDGVVHKNFV